MKTIFESTPITSGKKILNMITELNKEQKEKEFKEIHGLIEAIDQCLNKDCGKCADCIVTRYIDVTKDYQQKCASRLLKYILQYFQNLEKQNRAELE